MRTPGTLKRDRDLTSTACTDGGLRDTPFHHRRHHLWTNRAAIARYLDDADQRIRAYVSAKERLIALLEEERQAVIHQAVTRGLDPNVKLKPSGVEWLGDVPEHWEVRRLKALCTDEEWRWNQPQRRLRQQLENSRSTGSQRT